jgi:hypothetical protein
VGHHPLFPKSLSSKFFPSKNQGNKDNKKKGKRLLGAHEEYNSRSKDDDSQDEENGGVATVAIASTPSTFLFDSQNDNSSIINHKCLLAKATEVTPSSTPSSSHSKLPSMDEFLSSMKGHTKVYVEALMCQLGDAQDTIKE